MSNPSSCNTILCGKSSRTIACFIALLILALCFNGCGVGQSQGVQASLAHGETLKELKLHSDFVISGVVSNIGLVVKTEAPYSQVTLSVKSVLWQAQAQTNIPSTFSFHEAGGKDAFGSTYEAEDNPLYSVGQRVILFITRSSSGNYEVTDVPFGRFIVENNRVEPVENDGINLPPKIDELGFKESLNTA